MRGDGRRGRGSDCLGHQVAPKAARPRRAWAYIPSTRAADRWQQPRSEVRPVTCERAWRSSTPDLETIPSPLLPTTTALRPANPAHFNRCIPGYHPCRPHTGRSAASVAGSGSRRSARGIYPGQPKRPWCRPCAERHRRPSVCRLHRSGVGGPSSLPVRRLVAAETSPAAGQVWRHAAKERAARLAFEHTQRPARRRRRPIQAAQRRLSMPCSPLPSRNQTAVRDWSVHGPPIIQVNKLRRPTQHEGDRNRAPVPAAPWYHRFQKGSRCRTEVFRVLLRPR